MELDIRGRINLLLMKFVLVINTLLPVNYFHYDKIAELSLGLRGHSLFIAIIRGGVRVYRKEGEGAVWKGETQDMTPFNLLLLFIDWI